MNLIKKTVEFDWTSHLKIYHFVTNHFESELIKVMNHDGFEVCVRLTLRGNMLIGNIHWKQIRLETSF